MSRPTYDADARQTFNDFEREATALSREINKVGFDDYPELLLKLDGIVALCSELRVKAQRRADERLDDIAREEREVSTPMPWGQS